MRKYPEGRTYDLLRKSSAPRRGLKAKGNQMAIYSLHTEPASRASGKSAVAMAAYRSGGRLIDERTGELKDYSRKRGIRETAIIFPPAVSFDRQTLWNLAESAEKRKDARIAREIRIALPHELDQESRSKLAKEFAQGIVDRYKIAVDLSIHEPDRRGDSRNHHAHLLLTTREITPEGFSDKSDLEKSDRALRQAGIKNGKEQILDLREKWENLCNIALERQGIEQRISAKSYKERNINLQPTIHLGPAVTAMERRGIETENGTYNRAIEKNNLQKVLEKEIEHQKNIIAKLEDIILNIKNKIIEIVQPEKQPEKTPKSIEEILRESQRTPEKEQGAEHKKLSVEELLNNSKGQREEQARSLEEKSSLSISELLEKNKATRSPGIERDPNEIER